MYAQVRLLNGFKTSLTYKIPTQLEDAITIGSFVHVPLRTYKTLAVVTATISKPNNENFTIKEILDLAPIPHDQSYTKYINKLSGYYGLEPLYFFQRLLSFLKQKEPKEKVEHRPLAAPNDHNVSLTTEQQEVTDFCVQAIDNQKFTPTLLHGVTGSGKTEVYKKLICHSIERKKSVLFLVPEVTLAVQFYHLLKQQLPAHIKLYTFHSATSAQEKKDLWQALLKGEPILIMGVHLPVMVPIKNLGIIIIDEEHEPGYQEKKHPKINSKEAAILRAQCYEIPILLGSATPSINSLYQVEQKKWHFFSLKNRFGGSFAKIKRVSLLQEKQRPFFWLSRELEKALEDRLKKNEQSILFLNRRGYSFFVLCKLCGYVFMCNRCSVSLTLHGNNLLKCHYCDYYQELPHHCTQCQAPEENLIKKGIGTQQLAAVIEKRFPTARIGRADLDTTVDKKKWRATLDAFERGDIDILVGTQTVTKGYHFPNVTLVGIIWADANLHFPHYNATENTLQQLIQVAGRAGRASKDGLVIVQTFSEHPIFKYLNETQYLDFYAYEKEKRADALYPPYIRLAEIELYTKDEALLDREATVLADTISNLAGPDEGILVLGPATPPVAKIKHIFRRTIYIKSPSSLRAQELYKKALQSLKLTSFVYFSPSING